MSGEGLEKGEGDEGFCYLRLYAREHWAAVAKILGAYPRVGELRSLGGYDLFGRYCVLKQNGLVHVEGLDGCSGVRFSELNLLDSDRVRGLIPPREVSWKDLCFPVGNSFRLCWEVVAL